MNKLTVERISINTKGPQNACAVLPDALMSAVENSTMMALVVRPRLATTILTEPLPSETEYVTD